MKSSQFNKLALALGLALSSPLPLLAQHAHLNAGAAGKNQNSQVIWDNAADFIASSSYIKTLDYTNSGKYAGYYQGGITPTALPATAANAGPDPAASALGSQLQFHLSCLEGPAGGTFGFWEAGATSPSLSLRPGDSSTNLWRLSESDGSPGLDPFGHIHGRRFTATKAGIYKIGFTALDTCTNGVGGGPIHTPSEELPIWFQAGVNIQSIEPDYEEGHVHLQFGATAGFSWQLEASTNLGPEQLWLPAGNAVIGADVLVKMLHDVPPGERRFYRVTGTPITP
jgi:hypothetical protein